LALDKANETFPNWATTFFTLHSTPKLHIEEVLPSESDKDTPTPT
jgi:hypothetical protein